MRKKKIISSNEHESVHFYSDEKVGLEAIIAIHTTFSGISLGGCRIRNFSSQKEALSDVLRLSKHMTYKSLLFDLNIGGGKSVILTKENFKKTPQFFSAFGEALNSLGGQYIVSVDMGSDIQDMETIRQTSSFVIGYSDIEGGAGDPGVYTARGILSAMKAVAQEKWSNFSLEGKKICLIGIGDVGMPLSQMLIKEGAHLIVSDIDIRKIQAVKNLNQNVRSVDPQTALYTSCDILSPCAFGGVFSKESVKKLDCQIIAGAANNQLLSYDVGRDLHKRGIIYLPDFAINAGGLIGVVLRGLRKKNLEETNNKIDHIAHLVQFIIQTSREKNIPTNKVALNIAKQRYKKIYSKTNIK